LAQRRKKGKGKRQEVTSAEVGILTWGKTKKRTPNKQKGKKKKGGGGGKQGSLGNKQTKRILCPPCLREKKRKKKRGVPSVWPREQLCSKGHSHSGRGEEKGKVSPELHSAQKKKRKGKIIMVVPKKRKDTVCAGGGELSKSEKKGRKGEGQHGSPLFPKKREKANSMLIQQGEGKGKKDVARFSVRGGKGKRGEASQGNPYHTKLGGGGRGLVYKSCSMRKQKKKKRGGPLEKKGSAH